MHLRQDSNKILRAHGLHGQSGYFTRVANKSHVQIAIEKFFDLLPTGQRTENEFHSGRCSLKLRSASGIAV